MIQKDIYLNPQQNQQDFFSISYEIFNFKIRLFESYK